MQTKPTLFMSPGSHHSRRVRLLVEEMGIDLEETIVDVRPPGMGGENEGDAYRAINPAAKVPALRHGDLVLMESNAIMIYLAETFGPTPLWPSDPVKRAQVMQWQYFQAAHLSPSADGLLRENVVKAMTGADCDPEAIDRLTDQFHRWCEVLEKALESTDYLVRGEATCADLSVACAFMYERAAQLPLGDHPLVQRWLGRIHARPSWKATEPPPFPV